MNGQINGLPETIIQEYTTPVITDSYDFGEEETSTEEPVEVAADKTKEGEKAADKDEPEKEEPKQDAKTAGAFAVLARREKEVTAKAKEVAAKEAELNAKLEELKEGGDPRKYLAFGKKHFNLTFEDLARASMEDLNLDKDLSNKKLEQKIEAMEKAAKDQADKAVADAQATEVRNFVNKISDTISANNETYELIVLQNKQHLVFELIQQHAIETGGAELMSIEKAAQTVEDFLTIEAKKLTSSKKLSGALKTTDLEAIDNPDEKANIKTSKTLTNNKTASTSSKPKTLTEQETRAEAARILMKSWK